jgi:hypothetical protein
MGAAARTMAHTDAAGVIAGIAARLAGVNAESSSNVHRHAVGS